MSTTYHLPAVRELLVAAFDSGGISTLAFDLLPAVYQDFSSGMAKSRKIELLLDYAARHGRVADLLAYIQKENPYQYQRFAPRLQSAGPPPEKPAMPDFRAQRLADIQTHLQREYELLKQYEEDLQTAADRRQILRIQREIERQKEAIGRYQQEAAGLNVAGQAAPAAGDQAGQAVQASLDHISQKLDDLSREVTGAEQRLAAGQDSLRRDLAEQRQAILAHMDEQQARATGRILDKLDANQLELVELLLDAADRQQIAQWEAENLTRLAQQALLDLTRLRQDQPDAAQWQDMLALLERDSGWEQKVKLALPLIPGILSFESELKLDVMGVLNENWRRLIKRVRQPGSRQ